MWSLLPQQPLGSRCYAGEVADVHQPPSSFGSSSCWHRVSCVGQTVHGCMHSRQAGVPPLLQSGAAAPCLSAVVCVKHGHLLLPVGDNGFLG